MKNNKNSDPIPRALGQSDVSPVNWHVNLSVNPSAISSSSRFWTIRSLSLLCLGVGLNFSFSPAAIGLSAHDLQESSSVASSLTTPIPSSTEAIDAQSHRIALNDHLENEDPDLTGQPGTPDRTQGSGTR